MKELERKRKKLEKMLRGSFWDRFWERLPYGLRYSVLRFSIQRRLRLLKMRWNCRPHFGVDDWIALFVLTSGILGFMDGLIPYKPEWYIAIQSELIGIGASVLIIANAGEYVSILQEKKRLILQMGSPDNAFAIEAVRQLNAKGWLFDGSLEDVNLINANLSGANLSGANLYEANLSNANLSNANLERAFLGPGNLSNANLSNANLSGISMMSLNLSNANLSNANLSHFMPGHIDISSSNLDGAKYTEGTTWPSDFDPAAAGAILVEE